LAREGMTMIIVTHEMEFARNISSRVFYMDEGIIYEEGPPNLIFEHPQKEKTRAFIHRIRSLRYHISSRNYDLYAMQAEMEAFCDKHMLSKKTSGYVALLTEELLGLQESFSDGQLTLSYSEKEGNLDISFENGGMSYNFLEDKTMEDDLGVLLIKGRSQSIEYDYRDGKNKWLIRVHEAS